MKLDLKSVVAGSLVTLALIPAIVFGARTAAPVLTGLFQSTTLSVALPVPSSFALPNATTTGSVNAGYLAFSVTAIDGVGESLPSVALATTSADNAHAYNLRWNAVPGASAYRIYFSTSSSPQSFTQYFLATTSNQYTFTATTSPTFIPAGIPSTNGAFSAIFNSSGPSWVLGGSMGIGTSTIGAGIMVSVSTTTATSTVEVGAKVASGGRMIFVDTSSGRTTCTELTTAGGAGTFKAVTCP